MCLANSRKHAGRCVAGIVEGSQTGWIRPVSARPTGEVSQGERQLEDGSDPRVLDIISVPLLQPQPHNYQSENWILDPNQRWRKIGRAGWGELLTLEQHSGPLWINGYSSYHGSNDRVPTRQADTLGNSLKLIRVSRVRLQVHVPGIAFGDSTRRVVRAHFRHAGSQYILSVTDPDYEHAYLAKRDGIYEIGESFITVSLGEPHTDECTYKLVAAIMERARIETGSEK
ncbi:dual OB domain-containing protein [Nonomuraea sp. NPDC050790]|uniref:dual OB domain-containing protein n=1 Tax=Nonomuraea sp. NPDC050790 TaxID=3364371 RepID=UPI0037B35742